MIIGLLEQKNSISQSIHETKDFFKSLRNFGIRSGMKLGGKVSIFVWWSFFSFKAF